MVEKETALSALANRHPAAAPIIASTRLSTRKLPRTERRGKPSARSVPISRTRPATCAYMVIIAPSTAPKAKNTAIAEPSARMKFVGSRPGHARRVRRDPGEHDRSGGRRPPAERLFRAQGRLGIRPSACSFGARGGVRRTGRVLARHHARHVLGRAVGLHCPDHWPHGRRGDAASARCRAASRGDRRNSAAASVSEGCGAEVTDWRHLRLRSLRGKAGAHLRLDPTGAPRSATA